MHPNFNKHKIHANTKFAITLENGIKEEAIYIGCGNFKILKSNEIIKNIICWDIIE